MGGTGALSNPGPTRQAHLWLQPQLERTVPTPGPHSTSHTGEEGRRKKEEGRRKKEEGRRRKEEEEGRRKKEEEGRRKRESEASPRRADWSPMSSERRPPLRSL